MNRVGDAGQILDNAMTADGRHYHAGHIRAKGLKHIPGIHNFDFGILQVARNHVQHILHQLGGNHNFVALTGACNRHPESLGGSRRAVIHGCISHVHSGETADHGLPFENVAKRSLRDLALVRRIGCQEFRTGCDVGNHRGHIMIVCALPDKYFQLGVLLAQPFKEITDLLLAHGGRQVILTLINEIRGHVGVEIVQAVDAYPLQHHADIIVGMREIRKSRHNRLFCYFSVSSSTEQSFEFTLVVHFNLDDPGTVRILIDEFGLVFKFLVDGNNLAGNGRIQFAGGFHALKGAEILFLGNSVTLCRHINIGNVTHFCLCEVADAYDGDISIYFNPFVGFAVEKLI